MGSGLNALRLYVYTLTRTCSVGRLVIVYTGLISKYSTSSSWYLGLSI